LELVVPLIIEMDRKRQMVDWRANAPDWLAVILQAHPNKRTHCDPYFPSLLRQRRDDDAQSCKIPSLSPPPPPALAWSLSRLLCLSRSRSFSGCNIASYSVHMHR
jgi:hypothetical protein